MRLYCTVGTELPVQCTVVDINCLVVWCVILVVFTESCQRADCCMEVNYCSECCLIMLKVDYLKGNEKKANAGKGTAKMSIFASSNKFR